MSYVGNIYRPPSEAYSFILQITVGCSHNSCTFCSMYKDKKYRVKDLDEVKEDIQWAKGYYKHINRVFLADGDALSADTSFLLAVLDELKAAFPALQKIGIYAGPWSLLDKTPAELKSLYDAGLRILYLGLESGSAEILKNIVRKSATPAQMIEAAEKAKAAGFLLSVTIILGVGGIQYSALHAEETAKVLNDMQPDYIGALTLMLEPGAPLLRKVEKGEFQLINSTQILHELRGIIAGLEQKHSLFRSNHASNYLDVRGTLPEDKPRMLRQLDKALDHLTGGNDGILRPESFRRL